MKRRSFRRLWGLRLAVLALALGCGNRAGNTAADAVDGHDDTRAETGFDTPSDETGPGVWPWPVCSRLAGSSERLVDKARYLDALVRDQHLPDGLLRSIERDPADGTVRALHLPSSGLWTAIYLASQSLRYAVTGEAEAVENARVAARGLHDLSAVTGIAGLYGRSYARPGQAYTGDVTGAPGWVASQASGYEGWWWNDDVSKDTMDGILFGYAVALEHLDDPEILALVRSDVLAFVRRLVKDGLRILDWTGVVTEHGRLFYSTMDDFPGFNALLASSFVRTGIDAAGGDGADLVHFYEDCMMRLGDRSDCPAIDANDLGSYLDVIEAWLHLYVPGCQTSYDNIDMVFQAIYPLLRRETNPQLRERLAAVLRRGIWEPVDPDVAPAVHRSTHALYIFLYGALASPSTDDPVFLAAMDDAVCTLFELPRDRSDHAIAAGTQAQACTNRMKHPNAADVIPLAERDFDNYVWRLDPYEIPIERAAVPGLVHSPEDFLLAYWLGRYHGLLPPDL